MKSTNRKLLSDELHALIMSYMINNSIKLLKIRPPDHDDAKRLKLEFYGGKDEKGIYMDIKLSNFFD